MFRAILATLVLCGFSNFAMGLDQDMIGQAKGMAAQFDQLYNAGDATGLADLFTNDAIVSTPQGAYEGRADVLQFYEQTLKICPNHATQVSRVSSGPTLQWAVGIGTVECMIKDKLARRRARWTAAYDQTAQGTKIAALTWNPLSESPEQK